MAQAKCWESQGEPAPNSLYIASPCILYYLKSWLLSIWGARGSASLSRCSTHMPLRPGWAQGHVVYRRPLGASSSPHAYV